jgi:hypothetical protein
MQTLRASTNGTIALIEQQARPTKIPGCMFLVNEKLMPLVSLLAGWAGIDRVLIGDWNRGAFKMFAMFGMFWASATYGVTSPITLALLFLFMYNWAVDIIWTRRDYRRMYGVPTEPPKSGRAFILAVTLGAAGLDRFYVGDRLLGAVKLSLLIITSQRPADMSLTQLVIAEQLMYCWFACDLILSPLRARVQ